MALFNLFTLQSLVTMFVVGVSFLAVAGIILLARLIKRRKLLIVGKASYIAEIIIFVIGAALVTIPCGFAIYIAAASLLA